MQRYVLRRSESHWEAPQGGLRFRRAWLPSEPRRVLVLVHGMADHSGRYERLGAWFAGQHCAVHALDLRGHGRSEGEQGHVEHFEDFVDDLRSFLELVRHDHPGQRLVLVAHSMGGLVVSTLLCEQADAAEAAVISSPPFEPGNLPAPARLLLARAIRRLRPRTRLNSGLSSQALSRDAEVVRAYLEDALVPSHITVSLALELLAASQRTAFRGAEIRIPLLLLHGDMDTICLPRGTRTFYHQMRSPGSKLLVYPKLRHELFQEPEHEQVFEDMKSWILEREGQG